MSGRLAEQRSSGLSLPATACHRFKPRLVTEFRALTLDQYLSMIYHTLLTVVKHDKIILYLCFDIIFLRLVGLFIIDNIISCSYHCYYLLKSKIPSNHKKCRKYLHHILCSLTFSCFYTFSNDASRIIHFLTSYYNHNMLTSLLPQEEP